MYRPPSDSSESEEAPTPTTKELDSLGRSFLGGEPTEQPTNFRTIDFEQLWRTTEQDRRTPETTETRESFATAPELSEPTEKLFRTLLERKPEPTKRKMASSSRDVNIFDTTTSDEQKGELKLNPPKPFTGKRENLRKFVQDVSLYLHINEKIYDTDDKRIAFALSFMNDGDAGSYKEQLLEEAFSRTPFTLGKWADFIENLKSAFLPYDTPGDALEEMKALRMKDSSIEDHNTKFKMLVSTSGLDKESPAVIDYYRETLNLPLQRQILSLEKPPKTLDEWFEWAS